MLYHDILDPFKFYGAESGLPFEVMVEDVWMEDFAEHEDYISEHVHNPDDSRQIMFISYQVINKGDETYQFLDDCFFPNIDFLLTFINTFYINLYVDVVLLEFHYIV